MKNKYKKINIYVSGGVVTAVTDEFNNDLSPEEYNIVDYDDLEEKEKWIKAVLSNDETSTDEELISFFMREGKMTEEEAKTWVSKRSTYLNFICS